MADELYSPDFVCHFVGAIEWKGLSGIKREVRSHRASFSREVHDELGQSLTAVKMDLAWLAGRLPRTNGEILKRIRATGQMADSMIQSIRRISTELRPAVLDLGLAAAVEWQVQEFQARSGVQCTVRLLVRELVASNVSTAMFRISRRL